MLTQASVLMPRMHVCSYVYRHMYMYVVYIFMCVHVCTFADFVYSHPLYACVYKR